MHPVTDANAFPFLETGIQKAKKADPQYQEFLENKPSFHPTYFNTRLRCFLVEGFKTDYPQYCISLRETIKDEDNAKEVIKAFINSQEANAKITELIEVPLNQFIEIKAYMLRYGVRCTHIHLVEADCKEPDLQNTGAFIFKKQGEQFIILDENPRLGEYQIVL